eukprot:7624917-Pyramimonas_sp.AAC.1
MAWPSRRGTRIGLYCSDVSGAFDRVSSDRLLAKLRSWGIPPALCAVFSSWLGARKPALQLALQRSNCQITRSCLCRRSQRLPSFPLLLF